jgi:protein tyrosine/serine phosphatase
MTRLTPVFAACALLMALAVPLLFAHRERLETRHLRVVREGVLYRSGQMPTAGIGRLVHDLGLKTVVSLRDADRPADQAEEKYCREKGVRFVRIAPLSWDGVQGSTPVDQGLETFLGVMQNPKNHPVLVHCYRGVHRTGAYVAVYRMECDGWTKERALREMVLAGYDQLEEHHDLRGYLLSYRPTGKYRLDDLAVGFRSRLFDLQPR